MPEVSHSDESVFCLLFVSRSFVILSSSRISFMVSAKALFGFLITQAVTPTRVSALLRCPQERCLFFALQRSQ